MFIVLYNGAMGLKRIVEKLPGYNKLVLPVHYLQARRAAKKNGYPARGLRVIGVTGTNGKTTTCWMIWKMLNENGRKAGLLTTVGWGGVGIVDGAVSSDGVHSERALDGQVLHQQIEHMTTERVEVLDERIAKIRDAGAEFLVLEVTSHALAQYRTWGIPIEIAVMTNVTHEHLDYHGTFEKYRAAKMKLFRGAKYGVVNADDPSADWFEKAVGDGKYITYGIKNGDLRADEVKMGADGVEYSCGDIKIRTQIPGRFNVYNSLAAVAVGQKIGLTDEEIEQGIFALDAVEGRMTRVRKGQDFEVIVDYAHTPDALEKVFESVKGQEGRVIAVHGGAGRRDESTRALRGEILGMNADTVIITEDDTRDEDPKEIAQMFVDGVVRAGKVLEKDLFVELDRRRAIRKAVRMARKGDVVLILGKGHEKTILRGDKAEPFEDIRVVEEELV